MSLLALLPIATNFVIPAVEMLLGRKKGKEKKPLAIGILQTLASAAGIKADSDEYDKFVEQVVAILKPLGLDNLSEGGTLTLPGATPSVPNPNPTFAPTSILAFIVPLLQSGLIQVQITLGRPSSGPTVLSWPAGGPTPAPTPA